jgi:hypothetical protein
MKNAELRGFAPDVENHSRFLIIAGRARIKRLTFLADFRRAPYHSRPQ